MSVQLFVLSIDQHEPALNVVGTHDIGVTS
jgi:hypothetical protein